MGECCTIDYIVYIFFSFTISFKSLWRSLNPIFLYRLNFLIYVLYHKSLLLIHLGKPLPIALENASFNFNLSVQFFFSSVIGDTRLNHWKSCQFLPTVIENPTTVYSERPVIALINYSTKRYVTNCEAWIKDKIIVTLSTCVYLSLG